MSKRPFYLITHLVDCDGYTTYIDYLGVNAQAAIDRFKYLANDIKQRYFLNEDIDEENIFYGNNQNWEEAMNITVDKINAPGKAYTVYMNDDNCCWINIKISVIETGEFFNYPTEGRWDNGREIWTDNRNREVEYRNAYPNGKY